MRKLSFFIIINLVFSTSGFSFYWPIGSDGITPQKITSTFGEWRPADPSSGITYYQTKHFHDGVDIKPNTGSVVGCPVYGVENEYVWLIGSSSVRTNYHDYFHIVPNPNLSQGDPVDPYTLIGTIASGSQPHLHFNSRTYRSGPEMANNLLDPSYSPYWRFDYLYDDNYNPIIHQVIFTADGNYQTVYQSYQIPAYTYIDIVVRAEEISAYPNGTDNQNGVYKLGYSINNPWNPTFTIVFTQYPDDWNIQYVYDGIRQTSMPQFWYVVTNYMASSGSWYTGSPGSKNVYIEIQDEQGNDDYKLIWVNVSTGVEEENLHQPYYHNCLNKITPNPGRDKIHLSYQIANPTITKINIFNCMGRVIKKIEKNDNPGQHTYTWDGIDKKGRTVENGCYFVKFEAGDYKTIKKFVLVK